MGYFRGCTNSSWQFVVILINARCVLKRDLIETPFNRYNDEVNIAGAFLSMSLPRYMHIFRRRAKPKEIEFYAISLIYLPFFVHVIDAIPSCQTDG